MALANSLVAIQLAIAAVAFLAPVADTSIQKNGLVSTWSGQEKLDPMLEEPSSSWLLQEDETDETSPTEISSETKVRSLPRIPDVLLFTIATLALGASLLLRELCKERTSTEPSVSFTVKAQEVTLAKETKRNVKEPQTFFP